jgi:hypothetical protein
MPLTTNEQRQRRESAVLGFEALHQRRERDNIDQHVEEVDVNEGVGAESMYW